MLYKLYGNMPTLSNWLARLTVNQVPSGRGGSNPSGGTKIRTSNNTCDVLPIDEEDSLDNPRGVHIWKGWQGMPGAPDRRTVIVLRSFVSISFHICSPPTCIMMESISEKLWKGSSS